MWPWAHAAFGYLLYSLFLRVHSRDRPAGAAAIAVAVGTQLPDLVDKPLAWNLHVLEYGRSLAHSVLTGTLILGACVLFLRRRGRGRLGVALAIGYYSHLLGDSLQAILGREWADLAFLVWPLLPIPDADSEIEGLIAHLRNIEAEPFFLFGLLLTGVGAAVWRSHGYPGVETIGDRLR